MTVTPMKRKRKPLPIPETACRMFGFSKPDTWDARFSLRRSKRGVIITLIVPGFSWDLSHLEGRYPANFAEARQFVKQYGLRYGQVIEEVAKPKRWRLPKGPVDESWLESENPQKFAEAMLVCEHAGGYCGQDGYCHYGDCFPAQTYAQRQATKAPYHE